MIQNSDYLDLSNKFYQKELPDLTKISDCTTVLRLTALYIHDISDISHLQNLTKLNVSYTYIKNIPELKNLEELQMIEVDLDNPNELSGLKKLKRLKMTHDDINLTRPLNALEILHCAILYRPDLLYHRFPNLKEVRFEHIHPSNRTVIDDNILSYYKNLKYTCCKSSKTIIQLKNKGQFIEDFDDPIDDEFAEFKIGDYIKEFAEGRLEYSYIMKDLSHMVKYNICTKRYAKMMTIHHDNGSKSFEKRKDLSGDMVREMISDEQFIKIKNHYDDCYVYYSQEDDAYNKINDYIDIIKRILYNNNELNEEIQNLLNNFIPKSNEDWSVDKLFVEIKTNGLTNQLKEKVRFFNKIRSDIYKSICEEEKMYNGYSSKNVIINSNSTRYYDLGKREYYKELDIDNIKDVLWFSGKKYLLTQMQKEYFVNILRKENREIKEICKNTVYAKFKDGKEINYKLDDDGNEIIINEEPDGCKLSDDEQLYKGNEISISEEPDDCKLSDDEQSDNEQLDNECSGDERSNDEGPSNLCQLIQVPGNSYRSNHSPKENIYNNIFMKDSLIISDDRQFLNMEYFIPERDTARFHLNFYGRTVNFNKFLLNNSNGYIMLGTSGDEGIYNHMDALLDKKNDHMLLYLENIFFMFKNRMYTNHLGGDISMIDYTDDVIILKDGTVGWGGTFYPFDVVLEPHPKVILDRDIGIDSPLIKTVCHDHVYKCCTTTRTMELSSSRCAR